MSNVNKTYRSRSLENRKGDFENAEELTEGMKDHYLTLGYDVNIKFRE